MSQLVDLTGFFGDPAALEKACAYVDQRMADAGIGVRFADGKVPQPTADPKVFTLPDAPSPPTSLKLYSNGVRLSSPGDFVLSGNQITYTQAPPVDATQVADYRY